MFARVRRGGALTGLFLLAVILSTAIFQRARTRPRDSLRDATFADVTVTVSNGVRRLVPAAGKRLLALLIFSPTCPHTATVAPEWARWTAGARSDIEVLAISADDLSGAMTYANAHGWNTAVGEVPQRDENATGRAILARTPWVFLLDRSGQVRFDAHGAHLARLDSAIAAQLDAQPPRATVTVLSRPNAPH
ncbi:MAG TPA: hypothetical protein VLH75_03835 [Longimicrobiales bacterium]|nr:hypothetical protein [Longimicrobiales bacterium]